MNHLRLALRMFRKSPAFTALVVLTLALGIGSNTAIFSLVNATVLRALPYAEPDQLVHVAEGNGSNADISVSYPNFLDWRASQDVFTGLAIYRSEGTKLKTDTTAEQITSMQVSQDFFRVLGTTMAMGRELRPEDDKVGAPPVLWLTHQAWQRYFAGDPDIVGRSVVHGGTSTTVAGVLPPEFRFHRNADVFVPIEPYVDRQFMRRRENHNGTSVIARLKPGVTPEAANTQIAAISQRLAQEYPQANGSIRGSVIPLRERLQGSATSNLYLLLGAVGMVLLIACVNVANMLLARSFGRRREMAVRTALGATRRDLFRKLLVESLLLAGAGGAAGLAIGWFGYDFVARLAPWEMRELMKDTGGFDAWVGGFVVGLTLLTGIGFGLAPAWQLSHANPNDALKNTRPTLKTVFGRYHLSDVLVLTQVALAVVLLVGAGLLIRSLQRLSAVPTGLRTERVLTLRVATPPAAAMTLDPAAFVRHHEALLDQIRTVAAVESAAVCSSLPFTWNTSTNWFYRPDKPLPEAGKYDSANIHVVTPEYFKVMGIPLLQGELFTGREPRPHFPPGEPVTMESIARIFEGFTIDVIVSRMMAERYWPGEDAVGKTFRLGSPDLKMPLARIIGIVGNTTQVGQDRGELPEYYSLLTQWPAAMQLHLAVRTRGDPSSVLASLREAIRTVAPDEPIFDVELMATRVSRFSSDRRFSMGLFVFFAATALLLASVGIYGVLACIVGQRTREIGIRMALGAQRSDVLRNVMLRGLAVAIPGIAVGLVVAWLGSQVLQSQLFGISRTDLTAFTVSAGVLLIAAAVACALPAQRASKVNPTEALRTE